MPRLAKAAVEETHELIKVIVFRRDYDATFKGKTLEGKPHECQGHEIKPQGDLRSKPLRGGESLKAERIG